MLSIRNVDASASTEVTSLCRSAHRFGGLDGVLHMTEVLMDGLTRNIVASHFEGTFGPKAVGAAHLHAALNCHCMSTSLLFSSLAGLFGGIGSACHGSACAYLLTLAQLATASGRMTHSFAPPPTLGEAGSAEVCKAPQRFPLLPSDYSSHSYVVLLSGHFWCIAGQSTASDEHVNGRFVAYS